MRLLVSKDEHNKKAPNMVIEERSEEEKCMISFMALTDLVYRTDRIAFKAMAFELFIGVEKIEL
jgi:hypothetical protein